MNSFEKWILHQIYGTENIGHSSSFTRLDMKEAYKAGTLRAAVIISRPHDESNHLANYLAKDIKEEAESIT